MPRCAVQRKAKEGLSWLAGRAHVARAAHGCGKREARIRGGVKRVKRGVEAALLVKALGATVRGEGKVFDAHRVGSE